MIERSDAGVRKVAGEHPPEPCAAVPDQMPFSQGTQVSHPGSRLHCPESPGNVAFGVENTVFLSTAAQTHVWLTKG